MGTEPFPISALLTRHPTAVSAFCMIRNTLALLSGLRWAYRSVVWMLACPRYACTSVNSQPRSASAVAHRWRKSWNRISGRPFCCKNDKNAWTSHPGALVSRFRDKNRAVSLPCLLCSYTPQRGSGLRMQREHPAACLGFHGLGLDDARAAICVISQHRVSPYI